MSQTVKQSEAASLLGIATQGLNRTVNSAVNKTELKRTQNGSILTSSVLLEMSRRYKICANALMAKPGQCLCCLEPTSSVNHKFLQGHDAVLSGAIVTLIASSNDQNINIAKAVLKVKGVRWSEFIQTMQISHVLDEELQKITD